MSEKRWASGELFATDSPIPADQMIGRGDDVERMAVALAGATNLVVAGPRRTGKTSACDAALELCAQEGCYVATRERHDHGPRLPWLLQRDPGAGERDQQHDRN